MDEASYLALKERLRQDFAREPLIWGDQSRLEVGREVVLNNALINLASGRIVIEDFAFLGHHVSLLTGTHNYLVTNRARQIDVPSEGRDIRICRGAWIASNVTIIGPCRIGAHAVVCAGSVVLADVPDFTMVAGYPARPIRQILPEQSD